MKTEDIESKLPSLWIPESDPRRIAVLGKALEEVNELGCILARCIIQGIENANPDTGEPNREALADELDDVTALIGLVREQFNIHPDRRRQILKENYQHNWYDSLTTKEDVDA